MEDVIIFLMRDYFYATQLMAYIRSNWPRVAETAYSANIEELEEFIAANCFRKEYRYIFILAEAEYRAETERLLYIRFAKSENEASIKSEKRENIDDHGYFIRLYLHEGEIGSDATNQDEVNQDKIERGSVQKIDMYSHPAELLRRMLNMSQMSECKDSRIILFCSPWGRVGTSTIFALSSICAAAQGKNVLSINISASPGIFNFLNEKNEEADIGFEKIIYYLRSGKSIPEEMLQKNVNAVKENGFLFLDGGNCLPEIFDVKSKEIVALLELMKNMTKFSDILIDCGRFDIERIRLFEIAHRIIIPYCGGDGYETAKYYAFIKEIKKVFGQKAEREENKIRIIKNNISADESLPCEIKYFDEIKFAKNICVCSKNGKRDINRSSPAIREISNIWRKI